MAIYSLSHSTIGRSTHAPGTAGAHLGYITRASACRTIISEHIPNARPGSKGGEARTWLDGEEAKDRKNARVIDKLMLALPKELSKEHRVKVVRAFVHELAGGKAVPFFAAIHDKSGTKDAENPHAHVVVRDRCPETGKGRVIGMSEKGSTERAREVWERVCNDALKNAGADARIDRRSLKAQGVERTPQKHEGPVARQIQAKGKHSTKLEWIAQDRADADKRRQAEQAEEKKRLRQQRLQEAALKKEAEDDQSFYAVTTAVKPFGTGTAQLSLPPLALWITYEPLEARGARSLLRLGEEASFEEVKQGLLQATPGDIGSVRIAMLQSGSRDRFQHFMSHFSYSSMERDAWPSFLSKLDNWGRNLVQKITSLVLASEKPSEPLQQKPALPNSPTTGAASKAPTKSLNGPGL